MSNFFFICLLNEDIFLYICSVVNELWLNFI